MTSQVLVPALPPVPQNGRAKKLRLKFAAFRRALKCNVSPWLHADGKKSLTTQVREMTNIIVIYRRWPGYYFRYRAYLREPDRAPDLLPPRLIEKMRGQLNGECDYDIVVDKRRFRVLIEQRGFRTIREIFSKYGPGQFVDADSKMITASEASALLSAFESDLFVKPLGGALGKGAFIHRPSDVPIFMDDTAAWIVQERICQHPVLAELHPASVNTMRIVTTLTEKGPHLEFVSLRIGCDGSWIDNAQGGGMAAPVDIATGRISQPATKRYETDPAQKKHPVHPDTGVPITGLEIPYFADTLDLVLAAATALPEFRSVGWDIAILPDGPAILEANGAWGVDLLFRHHPVRDTLIGRMADGAFAQRHSR